MIPCRHDNINAQIEPSFTDIRDRHREIVRDFIEQIPLAAENVGRRAWTKAVKEVMWKLAKDFGPQIEVYGTDIERKQKEWLLDVVWYFRALEPRQESLLLALESEWGKGAHDVVYDFSKLLAVKAPIKIMLFESGVPEQIIEKLTKYSRTWVQHSAGDLFYAINFCGGKHRTWFYQTKKDEAFTFVEDKDLCGDHKEPCTLQS